MNPSTPRGLTMRIAKDQERMQGTLSYTTDGGRRDGAFLGIPDFHDSLDLLLATAPALDRHVIVAVIRLNRFSGLIASLCKPEMEALLVEVARRIRLVVGNDALIANMRR